MNRKLIYDNKAETDPAMVSKVIALFITIFVAILLVYTIAGSTDVHNLDKNTWDATDDNASHTNRYNRTPAQNATNNSLDQSSTFFAIAPIIGVVIVAVAILRYVGMI